MIVLNLEIEEVNAILQTLGELPTKTGAWVLLAKIKEQADPQVVDFQADETKPQ
jgi:hypothetical protein